ncbi:MAG: D-sedoheptulose-7-phosphate isomerase [Phycisphaerae bacterium]
MVENSVTDGDQTVARVADEMRDKMRSHCRVVESAMDQTTLLAQLCERIITCFQQGKRLYLFGNGGSAADAQHIAAEFVGRFKINRRALPGIALTTDTSTLTAVSNDFGADEIFERQVEALVQPDDIVWALSVSGTSPNVIRGMQAAQRMGAYLVGFTGQSGGDLKPLCDLCLCANHSHSDRVQEVHQLAYHLVCERVEQVFADSTR